MSDALSLPDRDGLAAPFEMLHHVALVTNDMPATVAFYRDVLGSEVAMAHRLSRGDGTRHYFITVAPNCVFAFFEYPDVERPKFEEAMQKKTNRHLDHVCFFVSSADTMEEWKARVESHGVPTHGYQKGNTFFFPDPNNIVFQVSVGKAQPMGFPVHDDPDPAYEV